MTNGLDCIDAWSDALRFNEAERLSGLEIALQLPEAESYTGANCTLDLAAHRRFWAETSHAFIVSNVLAMSLFTREVVPSTVVNDQDHGAVVTIAAAFGLVTIIIFLNVRLLIRWPWQRLFGIDDAAAAVASMFGTIQNILVLSEVTEGLGKKNILLTQQSSLRVQKMIYASDLLYVWALFWSKLAFHRWIVVETFACLIDVAIAIFPVALVWGLQMKQDKKFWVISGFAARLPTIPLAAMRLISLSKSLTSTEQIFDHATSEILTQAELCYSVISATIPCLRIFMQSVNTGLLGMTTFDESSTDRSNPTYLASRSGNFGGKRPMKGTKIGEKKADPMNTSKTASIELQDRALWGENSANAVGGSDKNSMASDSSERAIMVHQTIDVRYAEADQ
ncbi:hypothetical protein Q7P37_008582 [Cladosporium fusiforme]